MFCSKCGAENRDDAKFCRKCGSPMGGDSKQSVEVYSEPVEEKKKSSDGKMLIAGFFVFGILIAAAALLWGNGQGLEGRWMNLDDDSGLMYLTFQSDGTLLFEGEDMSNWDDHVVEEGSYWIEDGRLYIEDPDGGDVLDAEYEITDRDYLDIYFEYSTLSLRRAD